MKFKVLIAAFLLAGLFVLNGCTCPCSGKSATCPLPEKVASASQADATVQ